VTSGQRVDVFVEAGQKRTFASALDWPGWTRSGKSEELALEALSDYLPRYEAVAARAGLEPPAGDLVVAARLPGIAKNADFGALSGAAPGEEQGMTAAEGRRLAALLSACWDELARSAAAAPAVLPKGPRGGGRDRDAIMAHVNETEVVYARKIGVTLPRPRPAGDAAVSYVRSALTGMLSGGLDGAQASPGGWVPRYAVRRIAWHVLDHAWELQDKSA
jgi:hypothetical protein